MSFTNRKLKFLFFGTPGIAAPYVISGFYEAAAFDREIEKLGYEIFRIDIHASDNTVDKVANKISKALLTFKPDIITFYGLLYIDKDGIPDITQFLNNNKIYTCNLWYDDCYKFIKVSPDLTEPHNILKSSFNTIFVSDRIWQKTLKEEADIDAGLLMLGLNDIRFEPMNIPAEYQYDISFIGSIDEERLKLLSSVNKKYKIHIWGKASEKIIAELSENIFFHGPADYYNDLPIIYNTSKININISMPQLKTAVSQRIFDVPGVNGFLLSDYKEDLTNIFGKNAVYFIGEDDLNKKIDYYMQNENDRIDYIKYTENIIRSKHTYRIRFREMLNFLDKKYANQFS